MSLVAPLDVYLPFGDKHDPVVSPSCAVSSRQHKVPSYQETTTTKQLILRSDNFQVGHVGAGVRLALGAPNDLPWNREVQGLSTGIGTVSRECTNWAQVERILLNLILTLYSVHLATHVSLLLLSPTTASHINSHGFLQAQ